jgi:3-oxoadipate enol-lactonase
MSSVPAASGLLYFVERGAGPPIVLVHGLMVDGAVFEPIVELLGARHRVIVPDLRGHGNSRGMAPPYTAARLAGDVSRLLEHIGVAETAVFGYSHGGSVAQQLALDDPKRCSRLVLACSYAFNAGSLRERVEGQLTPLLIRVLGMQRFARLVVSQGLKQLGRERAERVVERIAAQDDDAMVAAWRGVLAFDSRPRLSEIRCPTLIVSGTNDRAVPAHHARTLHDGIRGSRRIDVGGADHALLWTHSTELARVTSEFLDA